ncbi:hypothetical protein [Blastopirellula marina]|uniref:Uncharacterized protein n=1 Tax=Blastopirellula marina TaxID=124 RepID=A0A2S8GSE9_9BACT|nr:hypothetical protein [Blastopirellula marina]PQO47357.1 hypothetical protein C5Y93_04765 [Blastopirellula marina]
MDVERYLESLDVDAALRGLAVCYGIVAVGVILFHVTRGFTAWCKKPRKARHVAPPAIPPKTTQEKATEAKERYEDNLAVIEDSSMASDAKAMARNEAEKLYIWELEEIVQCTTTRRQNSMFPPSGEQDRANPSGQSTDSSAQWQ